MITFEVGFSLEKDLEVDFSEKDSTFSFIFDSSYGSSELDIYEGEYVVIPKAGEDQELETQYKFLEDNVTVRSVPYYETSNDFGETVYIASEVN